MRLPDYWEKPIDPLVNRKTFFGTLLVVALFAAAIGCAITSVYQEHPKWPVQMGRAAQ